MTDAERIAVLREALILVLRLAHDPESWMDVATETLAKTAP